MKIYDIIEKTARKIIQDSGEVLETKEILEQIQISLSDVTRIKLFNRLNDLRGEGLIKGKFVGPGRGVWIWWDASFFMEHQNSFDENISVIQSIGKNSEVEDEAN